MHGADREAIIRTIRRLVSAFLSPGSAENGTCNQTHLSLASAHYSPSTASRCSKTRFALFVATDGVGHHRRVVPRLCVTVWVSSYAASWWLIAPRSPSQGYNRLNPLFRRRWYRQFGDLRIFQLCDVGDFVLVAVFLSIR